MAATLPDVVLPAQTWVNLYAATGLTVGAKISVQNVCGFNVRLCSKASTPTSSDGVNILPFASTAVNQASDPGAWAMCVSGGAVNVALAV